MSKLRKISGKECLKILCNKFGFSTIRQRGSHVVVKKDTPTGWTEDWDIKKYTWTSKSGWRWIC